MNSTYNIILEALASVEAILRVEFERQLSSYYDKFVAELTADGMDAEIHYSYPDGNMSRRAYMVQQERYNFANRHTDPVSASRCFRDPNFRTFKHEQVRAGFAKQAAVMARGALESYAGKLAAKVDATGVIATAARYEGNANVWGFSLLHVSTTTVSQVWRTKMIVNVSCLGKLFNQWPTRLVS